MSYRKKIVALSCAIAALSAAYVAAIVLDPARRGERADVYAWLDARNVYRISAITIALPGAPPHTVELARVGGRWSVMRDGRVYPARQARVNDFIAELSRRAPYPVRATGGAAHARLSLTLGDAARVTVASGFGAPLLDLLVGQNDLSGRNVYMRRMGRSEARIGEDRFSAYIWANRSSWYNLMLFPENESGLGALPDVMRITAFPPDGEDGVQTAPKVFTRVGRNWDVSFDVAAVNSLRVDAYVREILLSAGDAFADAQGVLFDDSRLVLEFGDGSSTAISFTAPDANGRRLALVSATGLAYEIAPWLHNRFFPSAESFSL